MRPFSLSPAFLLILALLVGSAWFGWVPERSRASVFTVATLLQEWELQESGFGQGRTESDRSTGEPTTQVSPLLRVSTPLPFPDAGIRQDSGGPEQDEEVEESSDPVELFRQGRYERASILALQSDGANQRYDANEDWTLLAVRCQLAMGRYQRALEIHRQAMEKFPQSIRHRWLGVSVHRYNNDSVTANQMLAEIEDLIRRTPWRYRDLDNQLMMVQFLLQQQVDAKEILDKILKPIRDQNPRLPQVYLTIGSLALEKADYAMAAENYEKAVELDPANPDAHLGVAKSYKPSDWKKAAEALQQALSRNARHAPSLLMLADQQVSGENYTGAVALLDEVLNVNPEHPVAWSYKAALAHLDSRHVDEAECRSRALSHWPGNPEVDHIIGRELSEKYRFKEGSQYQRRSLVYDPRFLPAKMQLAHDLLRLGQELEGWKLAEEVFDADQYSVVAHNLLTLRDNLSQFTSLEQNGFVVRMDRREADLYGSYVLELLAEAEQTLVTKYQVELEKPIFIEIFPRQQDFAIRTFGLPGGDGYLGVCFGRVITMNSPAAQGASLTSWRSVLWHEFCHVVTLQKTRNKMPRWLSEGISVYEEGQREPAWGQKINPTFQRFLTGEELTPVSDLSAAFLAPKSALHLQFAYYESSLVVQYLVEKYGQEALQSVLEELSNGMAINDALSRHAAPIDFIDRDFQKYAVDLAQAFAPDASFELPEDDRPASLAEWQEFNRQNPDNIPGMMFEAQALVQAEDYDAAVPVLERVLKLAPDVADDARWLLARCHRQLGNPEREQEMLRQVSARDADSASALTRLLEIVSEQEDWQQIIHYADRLVALNPLIALPHEQLAKAGEATQDLPLTAKALEALTRLQPVDPADIHFRLAAAMEKMGDVAKARRHVLLALDQAPRYRDAHRLLLKLVSPPQASFDLPPQPTDNPWQPNDKEDSP